MRLFLPLIILSIIISGIYFKFFIFGRIPYPADLLVVSYSPWFDYYKFPVQNPLISDVFSQFFIWKQLAIESFRNLQIPLWNPYSFAGTPLLATYHSAVLYPLNLLLFLPKYYGWGIYIYSQTLIAAISFYLFASQLMKSKISSMAGAVIFSLGSLMATWLELGTAGHAMAWLPLAFFALIKFAAAGKFRFLFLLIFSLALIILAGNAQVTTYSFIIIFLYAIWQLFNKKLRALKLLFIVTALILATGLSALQLVPSFDLINKSIRATDTYTRESNYGLLDMKDSFKFFIPDYFGNPVTRNYWGNLNYSETSAFLGILSLPLLIYFFFKVRSKQNLYFSALFLLSLLLTFNNPVSFALYNLKIPLLTSSYASRMLFITLFSAAVLCALAINHILQKNNLIFFRKTILWSLSTVSGIILGTLFIYFYIERTLSAAPNKIYLKGYLTGSDLTIQNFQTALRNSVLPFAMLLVFFCILFVVNKIHFKITQAKKYLLFSALLLILVVFDLGRYFLKFNPFISSDLIFPKTPSLQFLTEKKGLFRIGREFGEVLPSNTWTAYKLFSLEGYDPLYLSQYAKFMHFLNGGDIRTGTTGRYAEISGTYQSPYLDISNVKYYITILRDKEGNIPGDLLDFRLKATPYKMVFKDRSSAILENPNAKERAYFAKKFIIAADATVQRLFMEDKTFNPLDTTALSQDLEIKEVTGEGEITIEEYTPNKVRIKTKTSSPQILVLADQYDDGWKAEIDGKKAKVAKANLIFRAIAIPPGEHQAVLKYQPESFYQGLRISLASLGFIALFSLASLITRRF